MLGGRSACVLCVETCACECTCPVSVSQQCFTTRLFSHLCILSEVSIVVIVVSVIVPAIGIAGLAAGIAIVSCCVYIKWRKKTAAFVGGTQDHGELQ